MNARGRFTTHIVGAVLAGTSFLGLSACASETKLCSAPSESCPCPTEAHGDTALVIITDQASPAYKSAMQRLTAPSTKLFEDGSLGLRGKPTVILATYDSIGALHEIGSFDLEGQGDSRSRKAANAKLVSGCLSQKVASVPAEGQGGSLVRALPNATALARARGASGAAILAFGLSRSSVEALKLEDIDLATPEARRNVVNELTRVGILGPPQPIAFTFVDPDEGVKSGITGGFIDKFTEDELCKAVAQGFCQRLEVLP